MKFTRQKPRLSSQEALSARPVRLVNADVVETKHGGGKLKVPLQPRRLAGWLFKVPAGATKTFELDALGLLVWNACDGKTTVQQIIRKLAREYQLNLREAQVPTLAFLQMLAKKGLVGMGIARPADKE